MADAQLDPAPARSTVMREEEARLLVEAGLIDRALSILSELHGRSVERFVRMKRPARLRASVEDVCQDVWVAVARALPALRGGPPIQRWRSWLCTVAWRRLIDLWQAARAEPPLVHEDLLLPLSASITDAQGGLLRAERAGALRAVLARWKDPDDVELLFLRFWCELSMEEIVEVRAAVRGKPPEVPNSLTVRLGRTLAKLAKELAKQPGFTSKVRRKSGS